MITETELREAKLASLTAPDYAPGSVCPLQPNHAERRSRRRSIPSGARHLHTFGRSYTPPPCKRRRKGKWKPRQVPNRPTKLFVFDCESSTDEAQRLAFGSYRYYRVKWRGRTPRLVCVDEALFHGDDLDKRQLNTLRAYARTRFPAVDSSAPDAVLGGLRVLSRQRFVDKLLLACWQGDAVAVGLNLPFDLSRIAVDLDGAQRLISGANRQAHGEAVKRKASSKDRQAFSLVLSTYVDATTGKLAAKQNHPRIRIEIIDRNRSRIAWTSPRKGKGPRWDGLFLDLKTLAFALTGNGYSLASACEAFGVPGWSRLADAKRKAAHGRLTSRYADYNRADVAFTGALAQALLAEYACHPIDRHPCKAMSQASIGKSYLDAMGVRASKGIEPEVQGYAMASFFGGRSEVRIRRTKAPVTHLDFASQYTAANALMGLWRYMTASKVNVVEGDSAEMQAWIDQIDADELFKQSTWKRLTALCLVEPNDCVFPVRAAYGVKDPAPSIGSNYLAGTEPRWYAIADVLAAALLTPGRTPVILRVLRFEPGRRQVGLRRVSLRGRLETDPRRDFFLSVVEARHRLSDKRSPLGHFLKTLASATAYGIYAEMNPKPTRNGRKTEIEMYGQRGLFVGQTQRPEAPGVRFFAPYATLITSAARLMLALAEAEVRARGGHWALADTDSLAVVSCEHGGLVECEPADDTQALSFPDGRPAIRALSWAQVDEIVARFEALNPFNRDVVRGSILELEDVNFAQEASRRGRSRRGQRHQLYAYAISAKRYALFTMVDGDPGLVRVVDVDDDAETDDERSEVPELVDSKQHGLGHLVHPTNPEDESRDWIGEMWEHIVKVDALGWSPETAGEPDWLDRPAFSRITVSKPGVLARFDGLNSTREPGDRVGPHNFLVMAHIAHGAYGRPLKAPRSRPLSLVHPYSTDHDWLLKQKWFDAHSPHLYEVTTASPFENDGYARPNGLAHIQTYRGVLHDYRKHPESKSLGPDGKRCGEFTEGLLQRCHVVAKTFTHTSKESHKHEEASSGEETRLDEILSFYEDRNAIFFQTHVLPVIRDDMAIAEVASLTHLSQETVIEHRAGRVSNPLPETLASLRKAAAAAARSRLKAAGAQQKFPANVLGDENALSVWKAKRDGLRSCEACGSRLEGKQKRWCSGCQHNGNRTVNRRALRKDARPCACGCGKPLPKHARKWHDDSCRKRAQRRRSS